MHINEGRLFGRGIAFPPHIENGRVAWSTGPQNIREAIKIILLTEFRERVMLPHFGSGLQTFLFAPNTPAVHRLIQYQITQGLERWEPRIQLKSVIVEPNSENSQEAVITIDYSLVSTGSDDRLNLTIRLGR